ncbi:MAG TPA: amidase [Ktedonobacterales bacterium]|nr:amidase [Ktedonobacterales bacterium]
MERVVDSETTALLSRPAYELADLVRNGQISSRELVEATLAQIEAKKALNAFTLVDAEGALAAADAIKPGDPRPFAGVPIAIKELNAVAGQQFTNASDVFGDFRVSYDSYVVRHIRDAGFVLVGRTNAPEFGIVPVTEPRRFGATRNPWNLDHTPGGSSGGAAAAVAGGILPLSHATDGAGSIRIPAACCGLVGLKPSRGRVSSGPDAGDSYLSVNGCVSRSVIDTARFLDVISGYEVGDSTWAPAPSESFAVSAAREPKTLRIALAVESPLGTPVDPRHVQAARDAAQVLSSLGHEVEEAAPPNWRVEQLLPTFKLLWGAGIASGVQYGASVTQRTPSPELVEPLTWMFYHYGVSGKASDVIGAMVQMQNYARALVAFFTAYDILLTPALGQPPLRVGELNTSGADPEAEFNKAIVFSPFTATFNVTGQPAISLPLYQGDEGLPLGVQLVGGPLGEGTLLSLARQLETALPWADRVPSEA